MLPSAPSSSRASRSTKDCPPVSDTRYLGQRGDGRTTEHDGIHERRAAPGAFEHLRNPHSPRCTDPHCLDTCDSAPGGPFLGARRLSVFTTASRSAVVLQGSGARWHAPARHDRPSSGATTSASALMATTIERSPGRSWREERLRRALGQADGLARHAEAPVHAQGHRQRERAFGKRRDGLRAAGRRRARNRRPCRPVTGSPAPSVTVA